MDTLKKIIAEQMQVVLKEMAQPVDDLGKDQLSMYVSWLRALQIWHQGAHHVVSGPGFAGDHVNLYGKFYADAELEFDAAVEKVVGITNDKSLGCPHMITEKALLILKQFPSPKDLSPNAVARTALLMEKEYVNFLEKMFEFLELKNVLSLGLNDHVASSANAHEGNIYLLQQRTQTNFEEY